MKTCSTCNQVKPDDDFQKNGYTKAGTPSRRSKCRDCEGKKKAVKAVDDPGGNLRKCAGCWEWKELNEANYEPIVKNGITHYRHKCKGCRSDDSKARKSLLRQNDIVWYKCIEMAQSARSRVMDRSREYKKSYRSLSNPFEFSGSRELAEFLYDRFHADIKSLLDSDGVPTVDRKDNSIGYTRDNIQILSLSENSRKQGRV